MLNVILICFIIVASLSYLLYIFFEYGIQPSISATVYNFKTEIGKSLYAWFILCVAFPMAIVSANWMGFVASTFLLLDYVNPAGGEKMQNIAHVIGANVGMIMGVAMFGFMWGQWWIVGVTASVVLITYLLSKLKGKWQLKNETWWIEIEVLIGVLIGLVIEKI